MCAPIHDKSRVEHEKEIRNQPNRTHHASTPFNEPFTQQHHPPCIRYVTAVHTSRAFHRPCSSIHHD